MNDSHYDGSCSLCLLPERDLRNFRLLDLCWTECTYFYELSGMLTADVM